MVTITEDYVSFKVAKLLKEKGFNIACEYQYIHCSSGSPFLTDIRDDAGCYYKNTEIGQDEYSAPTLQMAMKWLREVHKKWITIAFNWHTVDGETTLYYSPYIMLSEYENVVLEDKNPFKMKLFNSYEEACEAACLYVLNNLI